MTYSEISNKFLLTFLFAIQTLDGDFFDQLRGYFTTLGQVEVDACKDAMSGFETVVSHANTVSYKCCLFL